MIIILYIIGICIFCLLPLPLQLPLLLLNTFFPDPIPVLDEIIMYASFIKKIGRAAMIIEWITNHKKAAIAIVIIAIILLLVIL